MLGQKCRSRECQESGICRALSGIGMVDSAEKRAVELAPDEEEVTRSHARRLRMGIINDAIRSGCPYIKNPLT